MADIWFDVDSNLAEVPVNLFPLIDDGDFKTREESVAYNAGGLDLVWNFVTTAGAMTQTGVTPTNTGGAHDWVNQGNGMYSIEIPASGGTINNDTEGFGWFTGVASGVLPWRGPVIGFRAVATNNALIDGALEVGLTTAAVNAVNATVDTALGDYDAATKAELDSAVSAIRGGSQTLETIYGAMDGFGETLGEIDQSTQSIFVAVGNIETDTNELQTTLAAMTEDDGGTPRFTENALEEAPAGGTGLDAAGIRTAIGLASANLDSQLSTIDGVADDIKVVTEKINDTLEDSGGGDYIFTEAALAQAPAGGSGLDAAGVRAAIGLASANLDTQLSTIDNNVDAILADTDELQGDWEDGGRLDLLLDGVKAKTDNLPSDPADQSAVEAAITSATSGLATATALSTVDNVVDAIQTVTDKLDDTLELDGEVYRFTENALEEAPTGSSSGLDAAGVRAAIGLAEANLDTQLSTIDGNVDDILADTDEVQATLAAMTEDDSGTPRFTENALEEAPSGGLDAAGIRTAVGLASANLDTQLGDLPTNSELAAALASADDAVLSAIGGLNDLDSTAVQSAAAAALVAYDPPTKAELDSAVSTIRGADSDTLKSLSDQIDDLPTATEIRSEIDDNSTMLEGIISYFEDMTEDDDGTPRFTANALEEAPSSSGLDAAGVRAAVGLSTANLDTQLSAIDSDVGDILTVATKLDDTLEDDSGTYRFTENALEEAPGGGGASASEIADAVWDEARSGHTTEGTFGQGVASVQGNVTGSVGSVTGNVGGNVEGGVVGSVGGSVGSVAGSVGGNVVGNVQGSIGSLASQAKADVNAEVVDALGDFEGGGGGSDPLENEVPGEYAEGTAGYVLGYLLDAIEDLFTDTARPETADIPAANASWGDKLNFLATIYRNKKVFVKSSGIGTLYADDGSTAIGTQTTTDDGSTATVGKWVDAT